jgi:hypothetical protein
MNDGFLKPPSLGMWMTLGCGLCLLAPGFWPQTELPAVALLLIFGMIALSVVTRWLGRCIGYAIGRFGTEFMDGVRDSRNKRL